MYMYIIMIMFVLIVDKINDDMAHNTFKIKNSAATCNNSNYYEDTN